MLAAEIDIPPVSLHPEQAWRRTQINMPAWVSPGRVAAYAHDLGHGQDGVELVSGRDDPEEVEVHGYGQRAARGRIVVGFRGVPALVPGDVDDDRSPSGLADGVQSVAEPLVDLRRVFQPLGLLKIAQIGRYGHCGPHGKGGGRRICVLNLRSKNRGTVLAASFRVNTLLLNR